MAANAALALLVPLALAACGQKGALYLPDEAREIVTRPTQTPADAPPPPPADAPNSPRTVDSPQGPASPAPEVVAPVAEDKDKQSTPKP
jgi:predicted small lipoprotein YifL